MAPTRSDDVAGIDVSVYQRKIDWSAVAGDGIVWAYAKATEGTVYRDPTYLTNVVGGAGAGVAMGAYHYAGSSVRGTMSPAVDEAQFFLLAATPGGTLPAMLDLEERYGKGDDEISRWALDWLDTVETATGVTPVLYMGAYFMARPDPALTRYPLWLPAYTAGYTVNPDPSRIPTPRLPPGRPDWDIWQYTSSGRVAGVNGNCDRNLARRTWWNTTTDTTEQENDDMKPDERAWLKAIYDDAEVTRGAVDHEIENIQGTLAKHKTTTDAQRQQLDLIESMLTRLLAIAES